MPDEGIGRPFFPLSTPILEYRMMQGACIRFFAFVRNKKGILPIPCQ